MKKLTYLSLSIIISLAMLGPVSAMEATSEVQIEEPLVEIDFYMAKNISQLLQWIKSAGSNDSRQHFLNIARQKDKILVVKAKNNSTFVLSEISVYPDYECMTYHFTNGRGYVYITINLSDSMKQNMFSNNDNLPLKGVISKYNEELKNEFENYQYKEGRIKILNSDIDFYYVNG